MALTTPHCFHDPQARPIRLDPVLLTNRKSFRYDQDDPNCKHDSDKPLKRPFEYN